MKKFASVFLCFLAIFACMSCSQPDNTPPQQANPLDDIPSWLVGKWVEKDGTGVYYTITSDDVVFHSNASDDVGTSYKAIALVDFNSNKIYDIEGNSGINYNKTIYSFRLQDDGSLLVISVNRVSGQDPIQTLLYFDKETT